MKRHSGAGVELDRGQVALTKADLERIPQVVSEYDAVKKGAIVARSGLQAIVYSKVFPDGIQIVVEEV